MMLPNMPTLVSVEAVSTPWAKTATLASSTLCTVPSVPRFTTTPCYDLRVVRAATWYLDHPHIVHIEVGGVARAHIDACLHHKQELV